MSRIGKQEIIIPEQVEAQITGRTIKIKGPKGELEQKIKPPVEVEICDGKIRFSLKRESKSGKSLWGLYRSLVFNMVQGVTKGWNKGLELVGVGYRVVQSGQKLTFSLGYANQIEFELPEGIEARVKESKIDISGVDKQLVGEVTVKIRKIRSPEPYKGKGIRYIGEVVRKKAGKAAKAMGAGA